VSPEPAGLAEVSARIAQLQAMLGVRPAGTLGSAASATANPTSSAAFSSALSDALGSPSAGAAAGQQAVSLARSYTGVPYRWGGTDPSTGLDCSGLTQLVYRQLGVDLPRVAADQSRAGTEVASLADAQPGDLVFFGEPAHHVGIYVGDGKMIDAPHTGSTVGEHSVSGYGTVSHIRRVTAGATTGQTGPAAGRLAAAGLGGGTGSTELLAASGLSSSATSSLLSMLGSVSSGVSAASAPLTSAAAGPSLTGPYADLFTAAGRRHGVDPALLSAVARTESSYDPSAVSPAGARGLMQLMPATARGLGVNPDDPAQAVDGAARLLGGLLTRYGGDTSTALAAYNAGPGAVARYGGVPPFSETRTYVQRVLSSWESLR